MNYAQKALGLTKLLKNDAPFIWGNEQWESIQALKCAIAQNPKLITPNPEKQYELQTDASAYALGATLFNVTKEARN